MRLWKHRCATIFFIISIFGNRCMDYVRTMFVPQTELKQVAHSVRQPLLIGNTESSVVRQNQNYAVRERTRGDNAPGAIF